MEEKAAAKFGKCPVDANLRADAVERSMASELLCEGEYGVGVGDPQIGWWSNNWVNTPATAGEAVEDGEEDDAESDSTLIPRT